MLPTIRQRVVVAAGAVIASWWGLQVAPWLMPIGPGQGAVLFDVPGGLLAGLVAVVVAVAPAVLLAGIVSARGHAISGVFIVAVALTVTASASGGSAGFFFRHDLPGAWRWLIIESIVLLLGLAVVLMGLAMLRPTVRRWWRDRRSTTPDRRTRLTRITAIGAIAGVIAAATGGVLTYVLVRNTEPGQVIGGLAVAFFIAGLVGHVIAPSRYPAAILASPLLVALVAYLWMLTRGDASTELVLASLYQGRLPGVALPLPLHYASAGLLGATLGVGVGESLEDARSAAATPAGAGSA